MRRSTRTRILCTRQRAINRNPLMRFQVSPSHTPELMCVCVWVGVCVWNGCVRVRVEWVWCTEETIDIPLVGHVSLNNSILLIDKYCVLKQKDRVVFKFINVAELGYQCEVRFHFHYQLGEYTMVSRTTLRWQIGYQETICKSECCI